MKFAKSHTAPHIARIAMLVVLALAGTQAAAVGGNAAEGAKKTRYCATCHGMDGNDTRSTPRLAGQSEAQFASHIKAFKTGQRLTHPVMYILTHNLTNQDIADMGAFYATQKVQNVLKPYQPPK